MTRMIDLSRTQRIIVHERTPGVLECHLEQLNKHEHWNGRAWFYLTLEGLEEMKAELSKK